MALSVPNKQINIERSPSFIDALVPEAMQNSSPHRRRAVAAVSHVSIHHSLIYTLQATHVRGYRCETRMRLAGISIRKLKRSICNAMVDTRRKKSIEQGPRGKLGWVASWV